MAGREERRGRTVEQKLWHSIKLSGSPLRESERTRGGIAPCLSPPILRNLREEKKNYFANNKITKIKRKTERERELWADKNRRQLVVTVVSFSVYL